MILLILIFNSEPLLRVSSPLRGFVICKNSSQRESVRLSSPLAMATAAVPSLAVNGMKMATITQPYLVTKPVRETRLLITELSCQFTNLRRISADARNSKQIFIVSPSGVQKEMYLPLSEGTVISSSMRKPFSRLNWSSSFHGPLVTIIGATRSSQYAARSAYGGGNMEPVRRCVVLDIEGTTTPISFVTDVLFPYARDSVGRHLSATYDTPETQDDIKLLRAQIEGDLEKGVAGAVPVPPESEGKDKVVAALVTNVEAMIKADRKITALKQLQGHIWRTGFQNNELEAVVYEDVPDALERWHASGIKVYIYSSGSRLAQRLIFGNSNFGDLRKYLSGFFDTKVGNKRERQSYVEIAESVGVDSPSEILFVTDVYQEATAAKAAGLDVIVSLRPGNGPLPENHGFKTVTSFSQI